MNALLRLCVAGAAAVAALAVIFFLIPSGPADTPANAALFSNAEPVDVEAVTVRNQSGEYRFYYEGDGYVLDDIPPLAADLDMFVAFMTNAAKLSSRRQVAEGASELEAYGLASPAAEVEIEFFSGQGLKLEIGGVERVSQDYYVAAEGFPGVYVMAKELAGPFLLPKTQILSRKVTPELMVTSPLSAVRNIRFSGGGLPGPIEIRSTAEGDSEIALAALSFGAATHIVRGHSDYQLDQTYGSELLGSLFGIEAEDIAGYGLSEAEFAAYGFAAPAMTIEYDMINGPGEKPRPMRLMIAEAPEGKFYAALEGGPAVYEIGRKPFMDLRYDKLLLRWFLTPMLMDLKSVTVETGGKSYAFGIDSADPRAPVFSHEGRVLEPALFQAFFRLLTSAAHDGAYLGPQEAPASGGEAMLRITYEYGNPQKAPDTLALYPGGARRAIVYVNGKSEFAMKDLFVQRVAEGCENLLSGNPIEEDW
jgi:hypothetical protein